MSQICSFVRVPPMSTYLILKSMPMVVMKVGEKESCAYRSSRLVFLPHRTQSRKQRPGSLRPRSTTHHPFTPRFPTALDAFPSPPLPSIQPQTPHPPQREMEPKEPRRKRQQGGHSPDVAVSEHEQLDVQVVSLGCRHRASSLRLRSRVSSLVFFDDETSFSERLTTRASEAEVADWRGKRGGFERDSGGTGLPSVLGSGQLRRWRSCGAEAVDLAPSGDRAGRV